MNNNEKYDLIITDKDKSSYKYFNSYNLYYHKINNYKEYAYYAKNFNNILNEKNILKIIFFHIPCSSIKQINLIKNNNFIQFIKFDNAFNHQIIFSEELKVLKFGYGFNKKINYPNGIFYIEYGNDFNQSIDDLPTSLEFLILGESFNQSVDMLSSNLKFLCLGKQFSLPINDLPNGIKSIHLHQYGGSYDNLPDNLIEIINNDNHTKNIFLDFTIKDILQISDSNDYIKRRKLYLNRYDLLLGEDYSEYPYPPIRQHKYKNKIIEINKLPNNLEFMFLSNKYKYKYNVEKFPDKMKYLKISWNDYFELNLLHGLKKINGITLNQQYKEYSFNKFAQYNLSDDLKISIPYVSFLPKFHNLDMKQIKKIKIQNTKICYINDF